MKVAYICADSGVPVFGHKGCSLHVQEIVRALTRRGAEVHLLATRVDGEAPADLQRVRLHRLPPVPKGDLAARERAAINANAGLRGILERLGPFDLVYERYSLWSFAGMEHAAANGTPGVLEVNAPLIEEQAAYRGLADRATAEEIARQTFGAAAAVVAVSDEVAAHVCAAGAAAGRVHVVPNGVDPARFGPGVAPALPPAEGAFHVGFVGTMKPWHGLGGLLDAFARLHGRCPQASLLLVGDGGERPELEARTRALGIADAVRFLGAVAPADVPGLLASMHVAVAPYPAMEQFYFSPLKVYEYMAAELPVVATRVGPLARLIRDGIDGILCPPGDPAALAEALDRLANDEPLRRRLGRAARAAVMARHTWDAVAAKILFLAAGSVPAAPSPASPLPLATTA